METDTRLTKNMLSMCMKPLPIFHLSSMDASGVTLYNKFVSSREVGYIAIRAYGHVVEVPFQFLSNLVSKFATRYR